MGRVDGKVSPVYWGARGQGRSHAVRLAEAGAHIVGVDACTDFGAPAYPMAMPADRAETGRLVRKAGPAFVGIQADVRDLAVMELAARRTAEEFGSRRRCTDHNLYPARDNRRTEHTERKVGQCRVFARSAGARPRARLCCRLMSGCSVTVTR